MASLSPRTKAVASITGDAAALALGIVFLVRKRKTDEGGRIVARALGLAATGASLANGVQKLRHLGAVSELVDDIKSAAKAVRDEVRTA